jgi:SHS2 domain-containing protein
MSYEELEHTADVRVRVKSFTLEGLFAEAARVLMIVMYGKDIRPGTEERFIALDAPDRVALMQEFLSEILFRSEVDNLVFSSCEVSLTGLGLNARLIGEPFNPERHRSGMEVKGISYSGLRIFKEAGECILDIILDV